MIRPSGLCVFLACALVFGCNENKLPKGLREFRVSQMEIVRFGSEKMMSDDYVSRYFVRLKSGEIVFPVIHTRKSLPGHAKLLSQTAPDLGKATTFLNNSTFCVLVVQDEAVSSHIFWFARTERSFDDLDNREWRVWDISDAELKSLTKNKGAICTPNFDEMRRFTDLDDCSELKKLFRAGEEWLNSKSER